MIVPVSHTFWPSYWWWTGARCWPLCDGAAGSTFVWRGPQWLGVPGLRSLCAGAHGEDLQPAAPSSPLGQNKGFDEQVKTSFHHTPNWKLALYVFSFVPCESRSFLFCVTLDAFAEHTSHFDRSILRASSSFVAAHLLLWHLGSFLIERNEKTTDTIFSQVSKRLVKKKVYHLSAYFTLCIMYFTVSVQPSPRHVYW